MAWCGLLINTANLELQADYTRYAGVQLASTLTVPLAKVCALPSGHCCKEAIYSAHTDALSAKLRPIALDGPVGLTTVGKMCDMHACNTSS